MNTIYILIILYVASNLVVNHLFEFIPNLTKELLVFTFCAINVKFDKGIESIKFVSFLMISFCIFLLLYQGKPSLASFRNYIFILFVLWLSTTSVRVRADLKINVRFALLIVITFMVIGGYLEYFYFHMELAYLKKVINYVDEAGYVVYATSSYRIQNVVRMSGLQAGPNEYGVLLSLFLMAQLYYAKITYEKQIEERLRLIDILLHILGVSCLLLSYSRAGIGVYFLYFVYSLISSNLKITVKSAVLLGIALFLILYLINNYQMLDIYQSSIKGTELSAQDRKNQVLDGFMNSLMQLAPNGFGTTDNRFTASRRFFFVESGVFNLIHEIGLVYFLLHLFFYTFTYIGKEIKFLLIIYFVGSIFSINFMQNNFLLCLSLILIAVFKQSPVLKR